VTDYRALLAQLAVPRLVGSPNHAKVRGVLTGELAARGFVVLEQRFAASPRAPLWGRKAAEGVNLVGVRPRARVTAWLAAHYDSKGQPMSMAARLLLATACAVSLVVALGIVAAGGPLPSLVPAAALGALFLGLSRVTERSPGALDNAAGVVTVLRALDALPADAPVGVIFPDAEELGLLGAGVLARERANLLQDTVVVNFDGLDDRGATIALVHRPGPVVDRVVAALGARRRRSWPVLVDGIAFARAARECVTIARGDWGTAWVVHTPRDTADRLTLEGSRQVADRVAGALAQMFPS